ncbi:MAG: tryptophan--tRNA ligase [archaeon]
MTKVTPWEVESGVDYDKLIKQFGTQKIDDRLLNRIKKHTKELHPLLTRQVFFSHRDMNWLLDQYEKGNKFFLYTGRAPSDGVHLGHLMPWLLTKWLQDKFGVELWFQFPDEEKFLFKENLTFDDTNKFLYENMYDVIALGFDLKKTHFLVDTMHANIMYKQACRVAKRITFSTIKAAFGFGNEKNIGSIFYTAMQAVPAFLPSVLKNKKIPCLIPLGIDQDAHFRISRDVIPKLGYDKPAILHSMFLPSLGKGGKMSSSDPNSAIYTTDDAKTVTKKVGRALTGGRETVEEQRRLGANPSICTVFKYLYYLFEYDDKKIKLREKKCKTGKLLCSECKADLTKEVNMFLAKHQKARDKAKKNYKKFLYKE